MQTQLQKYQFRFRDLYIDKNRIFHLLGFEPDSAPEPFPEIFGTLVRDADKYASITGGISIQNRIQVLPGAGKIIVDGIEFNAGGSIVHSLQHATSLAFFICTAGPGIENMAMKLMSDGNQIDGYMLDMIGSEVVEAAVDKMHKLLVEEMKEIGLGITNRYSPGYCGWGVSEQKKLFNFFPKDFCGIKLHESCLMTPIKSISGIIGIGPDVQFQDYNCAHCELENCIYRK